MILNNLAILLTLILVGCASTRMTSFKDPAYRYTTFQRVLIVVNTSNLERMLYFETQMVNEFSKAGFYGIEGYKLFPPTRNLSPTEKVELLKRENIDSYLSISVGETGVERIYIPPTGTTTSTTGSVTVAGNNATYSEKSVTEIQGGYTLSKPWAEFETKLIDVSNGNTAWLATSFTGGNAFADFNTVINSFCEETLNKLKHDNLIKIQEKDPYKDNTDSNKVYPFLKPYLYPTDKRKQVRITSATKDVLEVFLIGETETRYILSNNREPMDVVSYIRKDNVNKIEEIK
jgi:hypothetical protein